MARSSAETVLLRESRILVTSARVVSGNATYSVRKITSVRVARIEPDYQQEWVGFVYIAGIAAMFLFPWIVAVLILAIAIGLQTQLHTTFEVLVENAGGVTIAYTSRVEEDCNRVVAAISRAIALRG